jgi:hypothetical protein
MVKREALEKDFSFLKHKNVLAVLLFGSGAKREESKKSDIDICIVAPNCSRLDLLREIYRNLDVHGKNYDVRIFEDLPLYIKIQIIEDNEIIFTKDVYELYEYFYFFRKLWEDQAHRQKLTREELAEMLE